MLVLFFPFLAWLLFSNVNTAVPAPTDFEPVMETVQEDSDYYESVALKTVQLIDGDAPYSYYTVTQDVAEPGLYSYEYAFSEKGIL